MSGEHDPHDIVPDGFCEAYGADTIPEALEIAEQASSTTPDEERYRCPECGSFRITTKQRTQDMEHAVDTEHKCTMCKAHFDKPAPPLSELEIYTEAESLLETAHETARDVATFVNRTVDDRLRAMIRFEWCDDDRLETDDPSPGTDRWRQLVRLTIVTSKPWTDTEGRTLRETAEYLPFSRAWVNSRRQEWRDGQHRDLVTAPLPETADADTADTEASTS